MTVSEAYADLGGGTPTSVPPPNIHRHRYSDLSGWCRCGQRDDGRVAEGSPAWRASIRQEQPR